MRLDFFMNPKSIALIGFSNDKYSNKVLANLLGNRFLGRVFIVNKNYIKIENFITYSSVLNIPASVDLALIFSPINEVPKILEECNQKKIQNVMIYSDDNNLEIKKEIIEITNELGISIIGPCSSGLLNLENKINLLNFTNNFENGNISFINFSSQLSKIVSDLIVSNKIKISKFINLGSDIKNNLIDTLEYLSNDKNSKIIAMSFEKENLTSDEILFIKNSTIKKPIIIFTPYKKIIELLKNTGAITTNDIYEFIDLIKFINFYSGINKSVFEIMPDYNLYFNDLIEKMKNNNLILSPIQSPNLEKLKSENIIYIIQSSENQKKLKLETENLIKKILDNKRRKNIIACFIGGKSLDKSKKIFDDYNIPYFDNYNKLVNILNKLIAYNKYLLKIKSQTKLFFFRNYNRSQKDKLFSN